MPPLGWPSFSTASPRAVLNPRHLNTTSPITISDYLAAQWENPGDIVSILLLLGPEIVQRAVAQLAGRTITPVAFSFGWVAYAASALLSAVGDRNLMPDTDVADTLVIGAQSGHIRTTKTWILGRLLRDDNDRVDKEMENNEQAHVPPDGTGLKSTAPSTRQSSLSQDKLMPKSAPNKRPWEPLRISVYEVVDGAKHGFPDRDWVWFSGYATILVQLAISIISWILNSNWGIFMITICGHFLALLEGSLPQWKEEKWACPKKGGTTVTITRGNGSRHALVIVGKRGVGLDLEILAQGTRTARASRFTRVATAVLAGLWIALLGTVSGLKTDTWYLLGIGLLGSIQNVVAAGAPRKPGSLGLHIKLVDTLTGSSVAQVLKKAEEKVPLVGTSLVPVFFPGSMRVKDEEFEFWREAQDKRLAPNRWGTRIDNLPPLEKKDK